MNLEDVLLSEISQTQKDKHCSPPHERPRNRPLDAVSRIMAMDGQRLLVVARLEDVLGSISKQDEHGQQDHSMASQRAAKPDNCLRCWVC